MSKFNRPEVLEGYTSRASTPCGSFFLTLNDDGEHLREVRMCIGKSGNCVRMLFETIAILLSVMLQEDIAREKIAKILTKQMEANCGNCFVIKGDKYTSCIDYVIHRILENMASRGEIKLEKD